MKTIVITPTYNEAENIKHLVPDLLALSPKVDVLVVDDNSPDGTADIVREYMANDERVHLIKREGKLGIGTAHIAGFKFAMQKGYEVLVSMDADYSHHPKYIPNLVKGLEEFDVVIGSRYVPGGGVENCKFTRKLISHTANFIAKNCLGWTVNDATAGFRAYKIKVLEAMDCNSIFSGGYSFLVETMYRCYRKGFKIGESPITFKDRYAGTSKLSTREIRLAMYTISRLSLMRLAGK